MLAGLLTLLLIGLVARTGVRRWRGHDGELSALLKESEQAGIITSEQRERMLALAASSGAAHSRMTGAHWLATVAGLFVVAGISLLIATNWDEIGPFVRIGAFLVLLAAVGEASIRYRDRALALSVPLEFVWFFLPLLGIGLYGQTFQLSGDAVGSFLLWLLLSAPLAWLSPRPGAAIVHTLGIGAVLLAGNFLLEPGLTLFNGGGGDQRPGMLALNSGSTTARAWLLSLGMIATMAVQSLRLLPRSHRHHFVGIVVLWLQGLLMADTAFHVGHGGWLMVAALALTTGWMLVLAIMRTSFEERALSFFAWLAMIYACTFTWHVRSAPDDDATVAGICLIVSVVLGALAGAFVLPTARLSPLPSWGAAAKVLLVTPLVVSFAYLTGVVGLMWTAAFVMNLLLTAIAVGLMWHGSIVRDPRQINVGVLILVVVLITRFLDVFVSMMTSGIGFIVAGLLLAGLSWALERTRRRLIGAPPPEVP